MAHHQRQGTAACLSLATACALTVTAAPFAAAHDTVIKATPGIEETVDTFPEELVLEFSGTPKPDFNTLALSRIADDEVLFSGTPDIDGRNVSIDVPGDVEAEPGEYRIGFQITSSDGHATKGMTTFTFDPDGSLVAQETSDDNKSQVSGDELTQNSDEVTGGENYTWLWLLLGVLLLGGVAIAALGRRQQHANADKRIRDLDYNEKKEGNQYNRAGHTGASYTAADQDQPEHAARPKSTRDDEPGTP